MTPFCRNLPQRTLALGLGAFLGFAALAGAQAWAPPTHQPSSGVHVFPSRNVRQPILKSGVNLTYHGGPVITSAHVIFIFWGPSFNNAASPDYGYARTLQSFRNQFGTTPEYNTITQYSGSNGTIALTNLAAGTADWFDTTTPPANVTDAIAQGEVNTYLSTHGFDANAIYEVVLPTASYSSQPDGTTSCGGPNLRYCAYHGYFATGANVAKYSVQPYPSCGGCQVSGWSPQQNQEVFVTHETREAVTDPQLSTWTDANGYEADDKCALSPPRFFGTGGYGYQDEWSNAANDCVASTPISLPPNYVGTLDVASCSTLAGWGADRNKLNTSITLSFYKDGALLTTVLANLSRPDVGTYLGDNGLHGFSFATPSSLLDGIPHTLSVRFESSGTNLGGSPVSLTCGSATPAAPSGLNASYSSITHQFTLNWIDNSNNEQGFVAQFSYSGSAFSDLTGTVGANVTSYTSAPNPPIGTYQFRVRAFNGSLNSGYSNVASLLVANPSNGAGYIGCYTDTSTRALPVQLGGTTNTIESCKQAAFNGGYKYAGLQFGGYCFAGNTLGYALAPDTDCNMACTANSLELCGGAWRNSVYNTGYVPTPPTTSIAWIQTAESTWGPAGTLTAAGYAANGSGGVTLVWRERSTAGVWGAWNTDAWAAIPGADTTWSNTISSGNPTDKCHWFDAYTVYSGVTSATFHYTGAPGCP